MQLKLGSSVGKNKQSNPRDIKLVQALLNVYLRRENSAPIKISGKADDTTEAAIKKFQSDVLSIATPDGRVDPAGRTFNNLKDILQDQVNDGMAVVNPSEGVLTFEAEGNEGGPFHSRILHVPSNTSGLTIGRGYDMKEKTPTKIINDLVSAGVDANKAYQISKASSLHGSAAKQFIIDNDLLDFTISPTTQKTLFDNSYQDESSQVKRICTKKDVTKLYGDCDWDKLDTRIKDILVDLKFRGDYTSDARAAIQEAASSNNLKDFKSAIIDRTNWTDVPQDRFEARKKYISK